MRLVDELGFVLEGQHFLVHLPAWDAVLPFRIKARVNKGAERLNYGPVPFTFPGYPEGVILEMNTTDPFTFKDITGRYPPERAADMFWFPEPDILLHAYVDIRPHLFRIYQWIPSGVKQIRLIRLVTFEPGSATVPPSDFGYSIGVKEQVFLPNIHIDWQIRNQTNMRLRTNVYIRYAEYKVELVKDPATVFNLIVGKIPAYWQTFVVETRFPEGERLFEQIYKIKPIPFYREYERERALREIPELVRGATI